MGWEGPATWRQLETWKAWRWRQWNEPDRTDHYLMQLTAETWRSSLEAKDRDKVNDEQFRIKFVQKEGKQAELPATTPEERAKASKAIWGAAIHGKNRKK